MRSDNTSTSQTNFTNGNGSSGNPKASVFEKLNSRLLIVDEWPGQNQTGDSSISKERTVKNEDLRQQRDDSG